MRRAHIRMQMSRDMHMGALAGGNGEDMVAARHCEAGRRGEHRFESHSMQNRCGQLVFCGIMTCFNVLKSRVICTRAPSSGVAHHRNGQKT